MSETTATSKLTVKYQTVIPRSVRQMLQLNVGDKVRYRETPQGVVIEKVLSEQDDPFATFTEWSGAEDDQAYADL
ncbi:MAG: type II toxin-antitoxin system PrlF family antitoxin [Pseudomonadota bacterium]